MLSKADPQETGLNATKGIKRAAGDLASRKIWLPRLLYDGLPYFYLTAGFAAFFATLYITEWFWIVPHYLLFSAACLHLGTVVYRRRARGNSDKDEPPRK